MRELNPIDRALLRIAEDRVVMARRQLEDCHPDDYRRRTYLTDYLAQEEGKLRERLRYLEERI